MENKIKGLTKSLEEKDQCIANLEQKIYYLEESFQKEKVNQNEEKIKCSHCDFQTVSQHGLKVHNKRKHISTNNEKYPRKCELCDQQFENNKEMKKYMETHSYKQANFRCEDCDFVGTNKCTMEVHIGKVHSDDFECGMCEFIAFIHM